MIGGVCGGLGRYVGIDPIIFRIVLAALAMFGGVGLLLYALAWLLVPEEGSDTSELHRLFQGHPSPLPIIAAIVIGFLGLLAFIDVVNHRPAGQFALLLIVLAVVAVIALTRRAGDAPPTATAFGTPPTYTPPMYTPAASSAAIRGSPVGLIRGFAAVDSIRGFAAVGWHSRLRRSRLDSRRRRRSTRCRSDRLPATRRPARCTHRRRMCHHRPSHRGRRRSSGLSRSVWASS